MNKFLTAKYTIVQGAYWMAYCAIHAYASVFLLDKGFTNGQIGILLAGANILAVFLQPVVGGKLDEAKKINVRDVLCLFSVLMIVCSAGLLIVKQTIWAIGVLFMLCYMLQMICQPLTNTLSYEFINRGYHMNFGLARGLGSVSFAVISTILGNLLKDKGVDVLPAAALVIFAVYLLANIAMRIPKEEKAIVGSQTNSTKDDSANTSHSSFMDFAKHYKKFTFFLGGVVLIFFTHNLINDFMIQIITPIGGNSTSLGYALSLAAVVELPAMALFDKLKNRINCGSLLKISLGFFTVKSFLSLVAWNMPVYLVAMALQCVSYALFIPASIYYVNQKMEDMDLVKGQAYVTGAITLGGVFGTIIGGQLLDFTSVGFTLILATVVSLIGTIIGFIYIEKVVDIR